MVMPLKGSKFIVKKTSSLRICKFKFLKPFVSIIEKNSKQILQPVI